MIRFHTVVFVMLLILMESSWCHAELASGSEPRPSIITSGGLAPEIPGGTRVASLTPTVCQIISPDPIASQSVASTASDMIASQPTIEELRRDYPAGWLPVVEPAGEIFPSLVLALANVPKPPDQPAPEGATIIGEDDGWLGALVVSPRAGAKVRLDIICPDLIDETVLEAVLPASGTLYGLYPTILWKFQALRVIRQAMPTHILFNLSIDGRPLPQVAQRVRIRTINDCPFYDANPDDPIDMCWMFAAYVNEDHPLIDPLLKDALRAGIVEGFTGMQTGDPLEVYRQVFAVWTALRRRGIRYSSITTTAASSERLYSQHVRFIDETLAVSQANCIDGSVLFASVLRKIGIEPFLVMLPDHCFLGFYLDDAWKTRAFLDTSILGVSRPEQQRIMGALERTLPRKIARTDDWKSFKSAIRTGYEYYRDNLRKFGKGNPDYQIIDLGESRRSGIMPIARP